MSDNEQRVAVVTGASAGIGKATAMALAAKGWRIIGLGRDPERCRQAERDIRAVAAPGAGVHMVRGDLALLSETARMADEILAITDRVHALLNNAGGLRDRMVITPEGNEATFSGNHLGHFLLTKRLLPTLRATAAACEPGTVRVISVSSSGHERCPGIDWQDVQQTATWISGRNYCLAKLCNLLFTLELAERVAPDNIVVHAMHPGEVASNFSSHAAPEMQAHMATVSRVVPEVPARTLEWLASDPVVGTSTGRYFFNLAEDTPSSAARDKEAGARLWAESERLVAGF